MKKILITLLVFICSLAKAQGPCDSLKFTISYAPFRDTLLQIKTVNHSQENFPDPFFTLFNASGDTIANELPDWCFFPQIGQGSVHYLRIYPGMIPPGPLTGILQLYYSTVDSYALCTFMVNVDLCPDTCTVLIPGIAIQGTVVVGSAPWTITDNSNNVLASGIFNLTQAGQYTSDTICLNPGHYTYNVDNSAIYTGAMKVLSISTETYDNPMPLIWTPDSMVHLPFSLYAACITTVSVESAKSVADAIEIYSYSRYITLHNTSGQAIGYVTIYSIDGKRILADYIPTSQTQIGMENFPANLYIVKVVNRDGILTRKIVTGL